MIVATRTMRAAVICEHRNSNRRQLEEVRLLLERSTQADDALNRREHFGKIAIELHQN
jgi:hypothetical protein